MLIKNDLPILEIDTEKYGIIEPNRKNNYKFPHKCILAFSNEEEEGVFLTTQKKKIGEYLTVTKNFNIYETVFKNENICFCQAPLGAPAATQLMEFLIACGVKIFIAFGSCGNLVEMQENEIIIPSVALRDEGTSYHYIRPSREISLDHDVIECLCKVAKKFDISYKLCKTWTTDGFYRETKDMIKYRITEGCEVVEMECSALAACAKLREVKFGQVLFTADSLANLEEHDDRNWGSDSFDTVFKFVLNSIYYIDKKIII